MDQYLSLIEQLSVGPGAHTPELLARLRQCCHQLISEVVSIDENDEALPAEVENLLSVLHHGLANVAGLSDLQVPDAIPVKVCTPPR